MPIPAVSPDRQSTVADNASGWRSPAPMAERAAASPAERTSPKMGKHTANKKTAPNKEMPLAWFVLGAASSLQAVVCCAAGRAMHQMAQSAPKAITPLPRSCAISPGPTFVPNHAGCHCAIVLMAPPIAQRANPGKARFSACND